MKKILVLVAVAISCVISVANNNIWCWRDGQHVKLTAVDSVTFSDPYADTQKSVADSVFLNAFKVVYKLVNNGTSIDSVTCGENAEFFVFSTDTVKYYIAEDSGYNQTNYIGTFSDSTFTLSSAIYKDKLKLDVDSYSNNSEMVKITLLGFPQYYYLERVDSLPVMNITKVTNY